MDRKHLIESALKSQAEFAGSKKKHKYDIYNDRYWTCSSCKKYAHDMYLIQMKDNRELCPDCYLKEFGDCVEQ
jgi:rubrerythrin